MSKELLKPLTLELQHCVALETKTEADSLKFVRAPLVGSDSNTEFAIMEGGEFCPHSWYGSITRFHFCKCAVIQEEVQSTEQCTGILSYDSIIYKHRVFVWYITDTTIAAGRIAYVCKIYYQEIAPLEWLVKLCIVRSLKALEEVFIICTYALNITLSF